MSTLVDLDSEEAVRDFLARWREKPLSTPVVRTARGIHVYLARGVSSYIVQQAGGWRTASMMQCYAHLDPGTIQAAVEFVAMRRKPSPFGTDSGTAFDQEGSEEAATGV